MSRDQVIAVIGCGYWGKNLVRNFHALGALGMVCDPNEHGRRIATEVAPAVPVTGSFEDVLNDPNIVAVVIATPAETHHKLAIASLRAGKHVFVEKPLALNVGQGKEMCRVADEFNRVLMVGHLLQYHPCVQKILAMAASGELGYLQYITANRLNLGKIRREENALWSFAPHDLSVLIALAGQKLPEMVRCVGAGWLTKGIADTTMTALRFAGGIRAHVYVSWLNPFKEQKLTVVGSNGMVVFDDTREWGEKLTFYRQPVNWGAGNIPTPSRNASEYIIVPEVEPLREECEHFLESIRDGRRPRTDGKEGLRVLAVLEAAQLSLDKDGEAIVPKLEEGTSVPNEALSSAAFFVHPTAVVDEGAIIGEATKIWHFSHVMRGARVGKRCTIGQNVNIDRDVLIGDNVKIQNNVSIYTGVVIEDDVFLGPSCVLTNVSNPRSQVNRQKLYEKTLIRRGATIGANATILCGLTLGRYSFVGAGSVLTKDAPDYALMIGNPAVKRGWISRHGHVLRENSAGELRCPESNYLYYESNASSLKCLDLDEEDQLPDQLKIGTLSYKQFKASSA